MPRIVHFELAVDDPERAAAFYREVFDWQVQKWDGPVDYWLVSTGKDTPGIDGGFTRRNEGMPDVVNTVDVTSVDEAIAKITACGGNVMVPKMAVPGVGYMAYCRDTEGNPFGIMESDPNAA